MGIGSSTHRSISSPEPYGPPTVWPIPHVEVDNNDMPEEINSPEVVETSILNEIITEIYSMFKGRAEVDNEMSFALSNIAAIADSDDGWIQVICALAKVVPLEDNYGPTAITVIFDDCPLPSRRTVIKATKILGLSWKRAAATEINVTLERNICVVLGCIAERLVGPNSVAVFTEETLDYLVTFLRSARDARITVFALIALEKFAHTTENKVKIAQRLTETNINPLLALEQFVVSTKADWRQVGFCARWVLDHIFSSEDRDPVPDDVDETQINVVLTCDDVCDYLKLSHDGLEVRCDSYALLTMRSSFRVDRGCWFYECQIVSPGVIQLGWASNGANNEGYMAGEDFFSMSYDGCRQLIWRNGSSRAVEGPMWQPGDTIGCLLDIELGRVAYFINGSYIIVFKNAISREWKGYHATASLLTFQHCRFNFGHEAFKYPPTKCVYTCFNDHAFLTAEEKLVILKKDYKKLLNALPEAEEGACTICFDGPASWKLMPCSHMFCYQCVGRLENCPLCRGAIQLARQVDPIEPEEGRATTSRSDDGIDYLLRRIQSLSTMDQPSTH